MTSFKLLTVIIPVYNEHSTISEVIEKVSAVELDFVKEAMAAASVTGIEKIASLTGTSTCNRKVERTNERKREDEY